MTARPIFAALAAVLLTLGIASATSLGTFNPVVLSAATVDRTPCEATSVEYATDAIGGLLDLSVLPLPVVLSTTIDHVALTGLTGDCEGMLPVVTVIGHPTLGPATPAVLSTDTFGALGPGVDQDLAASGTDLASVFGALVTITDVRVTFVPA